MNKKVIIYLAADLGELFLLAYAVYKGDSFTVCVGGLAAVLFAINAVLEMKR